MNAPETAEATGDDAFLGVLRGFIGRPAGPPRVARDEVNQAMIRQFVEAVDDHNPIYVDADAARAHGRPGIVAPGPMLSTWVMRGYRAHHRTPPDSPAERGALDELLALLDERGFTGVVATDDEQTYVRELVPGDRISAELVISDVSPRKQTSLGPGHFVTTTRTYRDQNAEIVAHEVFRILRFNPGRNPTGPARPADRPRPFITRDTAFWYEGARNRELRVQRCADCGALRHPPSPLCPSCRSFTWDWIVASGAGTVHSFVVSHHPKAAGFDYPLAIVLVDLAEGTRLVADFWGDPDQLEVGLPVRVGWTELDAETVLPHFVAQEQAHEDKEGS